MERRIILSQSIEIEFKNLLTQLEYKKIKSHFQLNETIFILQENHYFDTINFDLKANKSALRIRKKSKAYELTLKQPSEEGLLETNQTITEDEAKFALMHNKLPKGAIEKQLIEMNIVYTQLKFFGTLTTRRAEWLYKGGLLVLDHSTYLNTEDYELEYEVTNRSDGYTHFVNLLSDLQIPIRKTENKIMRFYLQKYKQLFQE